jgi:integrase
MTKLRTIKIIHKKGRKSPWGARYYARSDKPVLRFFETKAEAEGYRHELLETFRREAIAALEQAAVPAQGRTVTDVIERFLVDAKDRGLRPASVSGYKSHMRPLGRYFPGRTLGSLTAPELEAFTRRPNWALTTQKSTWRYIRILFNSADMNPPRKTWDWPVTDEEEPEYLTPAQAQLYLDNAPKRIKAAVALGLFAGIRQAEIGKLTESNINRIDKIIRIPASVAKKRRARVLDNLPQNLWDILSTNELDKNILLTAHQDYRAELRATHHFQWISNGPRHSFATFHVAWKGYDGQRHFNLCETADILGHMNGLDLLNRHYRGLASSAQADEYFKIGLKV